MGLDAEGRRQAREVARPLEITDARGEFYGGRRRNVGNCRAVPVAIAHFGHRSLGRPAGKSAQAFRLVSDQMQGAMLKVSNLDRTI